MCNACVFHVERLQDDDRIEATVAVGPTENRQRPRWPVERSAMTTLTPATSHSGRTTVIVKHLEKTKRQYYYYYYYLIRDSIRETMLFFCTVQTCAQMIGRRTTHGREQNWRAQHSAERSRCTRALEQWSASHPPLSRQKPTRHSRRRQCDGGRRLRDATVDWAR